MIFDGSFDKDSEWGPNEPRVNKLVFIGKNLDKEALTAGFEDCLDKPENQEKIDAIMRQKLQQNMFQGFIQASQRDDIPALKKFIAMGVDVNQGNVIGQTALHVACMWGNYKSVETILEAGGQPNPVNQFGITPLLALARMDKGTIHGRIEAAKKMVAAGADLTIKDPDGQMAYEYVTGQDAYGELVKILTPSSE